MSKLAINGGKPIRTKLFPEYNTIGVEEKNAVMKVLDSGNLSQFLGAWTNDFFGGPNVKFFENLWNDTFGIKYSITVNSNTSGLYTTVGAIGINPGDEVIVSPYSMSASAVAPLLYGGIPIFADIDPNTYCLDPKSILKCITPRTKAIIVVHLFGHPADMDSIMEIARKYNLYVIEDCAQAPMGKYKDKYLGTIGDVGVFSLNYHKHIHTGEGGVIVTNNDNIADRCCMIRNHAENVTQARNIKDLTNLIGFNFRMTEIESAIGIQQIKKLPNLLFQRLKNVEFLDNHLSKFPALEILPTLKDGSINTYYVYPVKFNEEIAGISRNVFVNALKAELPSAKLRETAPLIGAGYVKPLYLQPIYQNKASWAYNSSFYNENIDYSLGLCPIAEEMHFKKLITHEFMRPGMKHDDLIDVINAFDKIFDNINELKN